MFATVVDLPSPRVALVTRIVFAPRSRFAKPRLVASIPEDLGFRRAGVDRASRGRPRGTSRFSSCGYAAQQWQPEPLLHLFCRSHAGVPSVAHEGERNAEDQPEHEAERRVAGGLRLCLDRAAAGTDDRCLRALERLERAQLLIFLASSR